MVIFYPNSVRESFSNMAYAIRVVNGKSVYLLGMYLGNVVEDEPVDPFRDYHPTLGKAIVFENLQQASTVAANLNASTNTDSLFVNYH